MAIQIVEILDRSIQGITRPFYCRSEDGQAYFVKGHGAGKRSLIAEYVGVVMLCPDAGYSEFKLLNRVRRITAFFEELDAGIYRRAANDFKLELKRIRNWLTQQQNVMDPGV